MAGSELTLLEVSDAAQLIHQAVDPEANVVFGVIIDPNMGNDVRLTIIAADFVGKRIPGDVFWERKIRKLQGGAGEEELDIPSFLRDSPKRS